MAIDASIPLQVKSLQLDSPLDTYAKAATIQNALLQRQALQEEALKAQQTRRNNEALNQIFAQSYTPEGELDKQALVRNLNAGGLGAEAPALMEKLAKQSEADYMAQQKRIETATSMLKYGLQVGEGVVDQASYEASKALLARAGADVSKMPAVFDPVAHAKSQRMALTQLERLNYELNVRKQDADELNQQQQNAIAAGNLKVNRGNLAVNQGNLARQNAKDRADYQLEAQKAANKPIAPAQLKEIMVANKDNKVLSQAQQQLAKISKLSDEAYSGYGAKERAEIMAQLPSALVPQKAVNTLVMQNKLMRNLLAMIKPTFGGQSSNVELKVLTDLEDFTNKPLQVRNALIQDMQEIIKSRMAANDITVETLKQGNIGGSPIAQNPPAQASKAVPARAVDETIKGFKARGQNVTREQVLQMFKDQGFTVGR